MTAEARLETADDTIRLHGSVDFTNVMALERQGKAWLSEQAPTRCRLDLGGVSHCNSAIAALLLSWTRSATAAGKQVEVENLPEALQGIIQLAGLEEALHVGHDAARAD